MGETEVIANDNSNDIYDNLNTLFGTENVAYVQLFGDEPELNQPHFPEYAGITGNGAFGDIFTDAGFTMHDCNADDCRHPNDMYQDAGVGRFSRGGNFYLDSVVSNSNAAEAEFYHADNGFSGASSKYTSEATGISDFEAIAATIDHHNCGHGDCHHAQDDKDHGNTHHGRFEFYLGHGYEDELSEPQLDKAHLGNHNWMNQDIMFAGACYTGGVVCPFDDVCSNHQVLGEWAVDGNGFVAWYGATGSAPWDPPVTMLHALAEIISGNGDIKTTTGSGSGAKTLGSSILSAAAATINAHGCAGPQCTFDVGGGMAALQFILIGDGAMYIQHGTNYISVYVEEGMDGTTVSTDGSGSVRLVCSRAEGGGRALVGMTSASSAKGMAGTAKKVTFRGTGAFDSKYGHIKDSFLVVIYYIPVIHLMIQ